MSNIYSAKFMNEASANLRDKVIRRQNNETYLFTSLNLLREMNSIINENTKQMYIQISEAESKEDENKIFADYFYQFKKVFEDFHNKVNEMKSRMIISVENKMETWEDLVKDDHYISSFDKEFSYSGYEFFHITDSNYPRLDLRKVYQREFDYIGQLMQDTKSGMTSTAKLKIIASVSNNFTASSGDKDWVKKLVKDMVDIDDKEVSNSYSEAIYNSLRDKYDINVNKSMLYTCREKLEDYEDVIDAATKLCDMMLSDLDAVAENISSYLFRNNDKKLKIKTDTDGVIDKDYRLDTYSMNQLNLFLKNKVNQIKKVLNVYAIAIGIKFDTVVDYIDQNIKILQTAKNYDEDYIEVSEDEEEEIEDIEPSNDEPTEDDNTVGEVPDEEEEPIEEEPETDDDFDMELYNDFEVEDSETPEEVEPEIETPEEAKEVNMDAESGDLKEAYLFESLLFELEMLQESSDMYSYVTEALMLEEEQPSDSDNKDNLTNVKKLANQNKDNVWQKIVNKLVELWNRFKEAVFERTKTKIKYLNDNKKYIAAKVSGTITLAYTPDIAGLKSLKIPDLNFNTMEKYLTDEETFCKMYFNGIYKEGESISDSIKKKYLGEEQSDKDVSAITPKISEAFDFCVNYQTSVDILRKQTDIIEKAQRVAKDVTKVTESVNDNNFNQYFNEFDASKSNEEDKEKNTDKSKKVTLYFRIISSVLAAEMTVYQKLFNELYAYCKWYIQKAGGNSEVPAKEEEGKTETKSADASSGEAKFN